MFLMLILKSKYKINLIIYVCILHCHIANTAHTCDKLNKYICNIPTTYFPIHMIFYKKTNAPFHHTHALQQNIFQPHTHNLYSASIQHNPARRGAQHHHNIVCVYIHTYIKTNLVLTDTKRLKH